MGWFDSLRTAPLPAAPPPPPTPTPTLERHPVRPLRSERAPSREVFVLDWREQVASALFLADDPSATSLTPTATPSATSGASTAASASRSPSPRPAALPAGPPHERRLHWSASSVPVSQLDGMLPLEPMESLVPSPSLSVALYQEPAWWLPNLYHVREDGVRIVQPHSLILPIARDEPCFGLFSRQTTDLLYVHAGRHAGKPKGFGPHVLEDADVIAAQVVAGRRGATVLLWEATGLTAVHCTLRKGRWHWSEHNHLPWQDEGRALLFVRADQPPLAVWNNGPFAELSL